MALLSINIIANHNILFLTSENSVRSLEDVALIVNAQSSAKEQLNLTLITSVVVAVILVVLIYMRQRHKLSPSSS